MATYQIIIDITDPDITPKTLRWLLAEAGEIIELTQWKKEN